MKQIQLFLIGLFFFISVALAADVAKTPESGVPPTDATSANVNSAAPSDNASPAAPGDSENDPFSSGFDDEPAGPAAADNTVAHGPPLILQGVAIGGDRAVVVINGKTYAKGQVRDNIELVEVRKREADIKVNGNPQTLSFSVALMKKESVPVAKKSESSSMLAATSVGSEDSDVNSTPKEESK